jgi:hypothetical protein
MFLRPEIAWKYLALLSNSQAQLGPDVKKEGYKKHSYWSVNRAFFRRRQEAALESRRELADHASNVAALLFDRANQALEIYPLALRCQDDEEMAGNLIKVQDSLIGQQGHLCQATAVHALQRHIIV